MDLNLYLGFPRSSLRPRGGGLGSDLVLGSPFREASSMDESEDSPAAMSRPAEHQAGTSHPRIERPIPVDRLPPFLTDPVADFSGVFSPHWPPYQLVASSPLLNISSPAQIADLYSAQVTSGNNDRSSRFLSSLGSPSADDGFAPEGVGGGVSHAQISPSTSTHFEQVVVGSGEIFGGEDEPQLPLRRGFLEPESRFRRLIQLQQRLQAQRSLQFPHSYGIGRQSDCDPNRENCDGSADPSGKSKIGEKGDVDEAVEEEEEEKKGNRGVDFECNICLDLAQEPVVTSCGHLFCWPCLYQWLHLHSTHRECPVCKGEVVETTITPVYGRGSSGSKGRREEDLNLAIPPRPRARRVESWRQRIRRPLSRRLSMGVSSAWRRFLGEEISLGVVEASLQETINSAHRRVATRLRARRPGRAEASPESEALGLIHPLPQRNSSLGLQSEGNSSSIISRLSSFPPRLSVGAAGFSGMLGTPSADGGGGGGGGHESALQGADHPSASSTMAVIQGANSAGSSRPPRNRGRSSSSVDVEECPQQGRKRRRTN
ncbi:uncharacterized protein LOC144708578 [Wolffia australiana]